MESKGLTIGNLPIKRMKGGEAIPVEHNNENYSITTTDISNYFTEYNLSVIAPTSGIDNGNKLLLFEEKPEEEKYASEFDIIRNHNILYNKKICCCWR